MKTDRDGCSTCPPGAERWEEFEASWLPRGDRTRVQYDWLTQQAFDKFDAAYGMAGRTPRVNE